MGVNLGSKSLMGGVILFIPITLTIAWKQMRKTITFCLLSDYYHYDNNLTYTIQGGAKSTFNKNLEFNFLKYWKKKRAVKALPMQRRFI